MDVREALGVEVLCVVAVVTVPTVLRDRVNGEDDRSMPWLSCWALTLSALGTPCG